MLRVISKFLALIFLAGLPVSGFAQVSHFAPPVSPSDGVVASEAAPFPAAGLNELSIPHVQLPVMPPELALQAFQSRDQQQNAGLRSYTDETLVMAELPDTSQRGAFELQRSFVAPHSLSFKPLSFTGDTFVKSNVIARLLQSEVDYVNKGDARQEALTAENYKFSYKGDQNLDGREVHVYQVKPRHKRAGLFKGHIYLDASTGSLVRSEGTVVKSPSFFIRKIEFVQDYADVAHFTLPVHLHSTALTRFVGRAVVDVFHRQYQAQPLDASLALNQSPAGQP
jgi:hypothetical protein